MPHGRSTTQRKPIVLQRSNPGQVIRNLVAKSTGRSPPSTYQPDPWAAKYGPPRMMQYPDEISGVSGKPNHAHPASPGRKAEGLVVGRHYQISLIHFAPEQSRGEMYGVEGAKLGRLRLGSTR